MSDHLAEFTKRLAEAMRAMGWEARPSILLKKFNTRYRGRSPSFATVARWLRGEGVPRWDKLVVLAEMLRVEPQFLLQGEKDLKVREQRMFWPDRVSPRDQALFEDFLALPAKQRDAVRSLVESLTDSARKQKPD